MRRFIETNICFEGQIWAATLNELASIYFIKMQISDDVVVESSSTSKVTEEVSVLILLFLKQGQWREFVYFIICGEIDHNGNCEKRVERYRLLSDLTLNVVIEKVDRNQNICVEGQLGCKTYDLLVFIY